MWWRLWTIIWVAACHYSFRTTSLDLPLLLLSKIYCIFHFCFILYSSICPVIVVDGRGSCIHCLSIREHFLVSSYTSLKGVYTNIHRTFFIYIDFSLSKFSGMFTDQCSHVYLIPYKRICTIFMINVFFPGCLKWVHSVLILLFKFNISTFVISSLIWFSSYTVLFDHLSPFYSYDESLS
jgi:hypothetical protein